MFDSFIEDMQGRSYCDVCLFHVEVGLVEILREVRSKYIRQCFSSSFQVMMDAGSPKKKKIHSCPDHDIFYILKSVTDIHTSLSKFQLCKHEMERILLPLAFTFKSQTMCCFSGI